MASGRERCAACVRDAFPQIQEPQLTRLAAIVQLIDSAYAWSVMKEYWDLDGTESGSAASEAIAILLGRRDASPQPGPKSKPKNRKQEKRK